MLADNIMKSKHKKAESQKSQSATEDRGWSARSGDAILEMMLLESGRRGGNSWELSEKLLLPDLSCRRCIAVGELCCQVEEFRKSAGCTVSDRISSETLQLQEPWTPTTVQTWAEQNHKWKIYGR